MLQSFADRIVGTGDVTNQNTVITWKFLSNVCGLEIGGNLLAGDGLPPSGYHYTDFIQVSTLKE